MTSEDRFQHDDAAYVLGALDPDERTAFEEHLRSCPECALRVDAARDAAGMLDGITAEDLAAEPELPATLLPGLLRRARQERRRSHWLVGTLAGVAAACAIALAVVLWPGGASSPAGRQMHVVAAAPLRATAVLAAMPWGTRIELHCHYVDGAWPSNEPYDLIVYRAGGGTQRLGSWTIPAGRDMTYESGTSLRRDEITAIAVTLADGRPVLRLTT